MQSIEYIDDLIARMNDKTLYKNSNDSISFQACREAEKLDDLTVVDLIISKIELEKIKDFSHISKYAVRLLKGIELNDLEEYFKVNPIINGNHHCKEKG